jgi:predicted alpha/beta-hydrolase family hydrolase
MADFQESLHKVPVTPELGADPLGEVSVSVARPKEFRAAALMAHGAGGNMNSPLLVRLQHGLAARSMAAARFNFLYTEQTRRAPDRRPQLEACWRSVTGWLREELSPEAVFLGGKSMGGRMASYVAADGYPCAGLFFLGYPLHPPGQVDKLRRDHLPRIQVPMLFISGTRDSLCRLDLLQDVVADIGERATLHIIEGGDHSFKVPKRQGRSETQITEEILEVLVGWLRSAGGGR